MNATDFSAGDRFALFMDLRSMRDNDLHGSGLRLVNTKEGVKLAINRKASGLGNVKRHMNSSTFPSKKNRNFYVKKMVPKKRPHVAVDHYTPQHCISFRWAVTFSYIFLP